MTKVMTPISIQVPITDKDGKPTPSFHRWLQQLSLGTLITNTKGTLDVNSTASSTAKGVLTYFDGGGPYGWPSSSARVAFSRFLMENPDGSFVGMGGTAAAGSQMFGAVDPAFTHWWNFAQISGSKYLIDGDMSYSFTLDPYVNANKIYHQGNLSFGTGLTYSGGVLTASGGGGAAWDFSPPLAASFSKVSGDATQLTLTDDTNVGLLVDHGAATGTYVERIAYRTLSNKALDWTLVAKFKRIFGQTNYRSVGLRIRDSISNHTFMYDLRWDGAPEIAVDKYNDLVGTSGIVGFQTAAVAGSVFEWQRIRHTGGNYLFDWSPDGKQWANIFTISDTAHTTNRGDQVGFGSLFWNTGPQLQYSIPYWSLTGPGV